MCRGVTGLSSGPCGSCGKPLTSPVRRLVKPAAEAVKPEEVVKPEVVRSLRRGEWPRAPVADVTLERVSEAVEYLV